MGSSRIRTLAPEWTRIASDSRRRSPPESPSTGFSAASPENRNWPSSARALFGVSFVARCDRLDHVGGRVELLGVLGEHAELDVVAAPQLARVELALAGERRDQRRLARAVGADQRHVLAALEPQLGVAQQLAVADPQLGVLELEDDAARALGRLEREAEALAVARVARDALHLVQALRARLRLARAGAGAEARDEALEPLDLLLLALDRAPERELARRLLLAPRVPRALEEARAAGLELEHRGADRLEEPAVVGDEHDRGVERLQVRLQPLQRADVEVVRRLVEQQQVGVAGERARERGARQLAARERGERAIEVTVAEAEAMQRRVDALAPAVAARVLEARLRARVGVERGGVGGAAGHRRLELREPLLDREQLLGAREHVVAQRERALARRALVVQRDARALAEGELAAVDRGLSGEHPQQRRLARAVAPGQRQSLPALEPERDAAQERLPHHVLGEVGGDDDGHADEGRRAIYSGAMRRALHTLVADRDRARAERPAGARRRGPRRRRGPLRRDVGQGRHERRLHHHRRVPGADLPC